MWFSFPNVTALVQDGIIHEAHEDISSMVDLAIPLPTECSLMV
jgi:hypothetical protein